MYPQTHTGQGLTKQSSPGLARPLLWPGLKHSWTQQS